MIHVTRKKFIYRAALLLAAAGVPASLLKRLEASETELPVRKVVRIPVLQETDGTWALEVKTSSGRGKYFYLNRSALEIWELIDGTRTPGDIARELSDRYGISREESEKAVNQMIHSMKEQRLIV